MLRIDRVIKPWKDAAALNEHINLYGFWNDRAFLTKSGDLGMVLAVQGVDYESLDQTQQEEAVNDVLEAAFEILRSHLMSVNIFSSKIGRIFHLPTTKIP